LQKLEQDDDDEYLNSSWADSGSLKRQAHGLENVRFRFRKWAATGLVDRRAVSHGPRSRRRSPERRPNPKKNSWGNRKAINPKYFYPKQSTTTQRMRPNLNTFRAVSGT